MDRMNISLCDTASSSRKDSSHRPDKQEFLLA